MVRNMKNFILLLTGYQMVYYENEGHISSISANKHSELINVFGFLFVYGLFEDMVIKQDVTY
jgi:hypothetical protein